MNFHLLVQSASSEMQVLTVGFSQRSNLIVGKAERRQRRGRLHSFSLGKEAK